MESVIFSVDLDAWYDAAIIKALQPNVQPNKCTDRIIEPTMWLMDALEHYGSKATFFVLGRLVKKYPSLIQMITARGHEVASHGYDHIPLTERTYEETVLDMRKAKESLEQCIGHRIVGYRAPCFSITKANEWVFDALAETGHLYDSSVYPFAFHPSYGIKNSPLSPYYAQSNIVEFPLSCLSVMGTRIPCSGGAYFRWTPLRFTKHCIDTITRQNRPFVFYIHPWELDDAQPRVGQMSLKYLRHYSFLTTTRKKIIDLLETYKTMSFTEWSLHHPSSIDAPQTDTSAQILLTPFPNTGNRLRWE